MYIVLYPWPFILISRCLTKLRTKRETAEQNSQKIGHQKKGKLWKKKLYLFKAAAERFPNKFVWIQTAGNARAESALGGRRKTKEREGRCDAKIKTQLAVSTSNEVVVLGASVWEAHFTSIKGFDKAKKAQVHFPFHLQQIIMHFFIVIILHFLNVNQVIFLSYYG